jgi:AraC-like DNA-binding protein
MIRQIHLDIEIAANQKQLLSCDEKELPCICHYAVNQQNFAQDVGWHWHEMIEIDYVTSGILEFRDQNRILRLKKGEAVFINANLLHAYHVSAGAEYYVLLFDPRLISGHFGSVFDLKYTSPVINNRNLTSLHLVPDGEVSVSMIGELFHAMNAMRDEKPGFEFQVRESMSRFWLSLFEETENLRAVGKPVSYQDAERIKKMLQYIYDHFSEPVTLGDIAASAGIGERECTRCFRHTMKEPPIRYLTRYRLQMAAKALLDTSELVSVIAEKCGFVSDSYFGKSFRTMFGDTPRQFRKKHALQSLQ